MSTLVEKAEALAVDVACTEDELRVVLSDGRTVAVPLAWFPRLAGASAKQRAGWDLIGGGVGIHWEAVDEDISVASLLQPENFMRLPDKALQSTTRGPRRAKKSKPVRAARGSTRAVSVTGATFPEVSAPEAQRVQRSEVTPALALLGPCGRVEPSSNL